MLAVTLLALLAPPAAAATPGPAPRPCAHDVRQLCAKVKPGAGRLNKCLANNEARLTAACREQRRELAERVARFQEACHADMERFCKGVRRNNPRIASCLKAHAPQLAADCRAQLAPGRAALEQLAQ
jgi:hypothetical protein